MCACCFQPLCRDEEQLFLLTIKEQHVRVELRLGVGVVELNHTIVCAITNLCATAIVTDDT